MVTAKGELTRERILEAAVDLLVVGGVDNLNLDHVLLNTGTSKSQLFRAFPGGKKELRSAATRRQVERLWQSGQRRELDSWGAWDAWVEGVVSLHADQLVDDACEVAAMAARALDTDLGDRAVVGRAVNEWFDAFRRGLHSMKMAGSLRPDAPEEDLAALMLAAVEGAAVLDKATRSQRFMEAALRSALSHLKTFAA